MFHMMEEMSAWSIRSQTLERRYRVGACPILAVKAEYPLLLPASNGEDGVITAGKAAAERFNRFYGEAAERFVSAGLARFSEELGRAYTVLPPEAACIFARRELSCRMVLCKSETEAAELYEVRVERASGFRRGNLHSCRLICRHLWCFPEGILQNGGAVES